MPTAHPTEAEGATHQDGQNSDQAMGGGGGGAGGVDETLEVTVHASESGGLVFTPAVVNIPIGQLVMLTLINDGLIEHDLEVIEFPAELAEADHVMESSDQTNMVEEHHGEGVVAAHAKPGQSTSVTFTPTQVGEFEFICTIPGHREAGMVGRLVVGG